MKLFLLFFLSYSLYAQNLEWDKNLVIGELSNGFKYTLKQNAKPSARAELRLIVHAGALEEGTHDGVAHFVEHMAFNGTKNFKKNSMISYLESMGVGFGDHLNANTSPDRTKYKLSIPLENNNLQKALDIFKEWATNINFSQKEVNKERGVIIEEARATNSIAFKINEQIRPILYANSNYSNKNVIGDIESIKKINAQMLIEFYKTWYRPELMHFVAVGDFDAKELEQQIKSTFSSLINTSLKHRPSKIVPIVKKTRVVFAQNNQAVQNCLLVYFMHKKTKIQTVAQYKKQELKRLAISLFNQENGSLLDNENRSARSISMRTEKFGSNLEAFVYIAPYQGMKELDVLSDLIGGAYSVDKFGFSKQSLSKLKKIHKQIDEDRSDSIDSSMYAHQITNTILNNSILVDAKFKQKISRELIAGVTTEELTKVFSEMLNTKSKVIEYDVTSMHKVSKRAIKKTIKMAKQNLKKNEIKSNLPSKILEKSLKHTEIIDESYNEKHKYWKFNLKNNITIFYKHNTSDKNMLNLHSFNYGGSSILDDNELCDARYTTQMIVDSGLANYTKKDVQGIYAGKNVSVSPYISQYASGFYGASSNRDFETMLEMIYLYHTKYKVDNIVFNNKKSILIYDTKELERNPKEKFKKDFLKFYYKNNKRYLKEDSSDLKGISKEKMLEIYKNNFANAYGSTYIIVGDIEYKKVKNLTSKYLANLDTSKKKNSYKIDKFQPLKGKQSFIREYQTDNVSNILLSYNLDMPYSEQNNVKLFAFRHVLNTKLRELIREEKSGVYSIKVNANLNRFSTIGANISIIFDCDPFRKDELSRYVQQTIKDMSENIIEKKYLEAYIKKDLQSLSLIQNKSDFFMRYLLDYAFFNDNIGEMHNYKAYYNNLTVDDIKKIATDCILSNNYQNLQLNPVR